MNHGSALFHTTLFLLFFAKKVNSRRWYAPILAGTGLGMLINVRPYTALAVAIPVCIYCSGRIGKRFSETPTASIGTDPGYTLFHWHSV